MLSNGHNQDASGPEEVKKAYRTLFAKGQISPDKMPQWLKDEQINPDAATTPHKDDTIADLVAVIKGAGQDVQKAILAAIGGQPEISKPKRRNRAKPIPDNSGTLTDLNDIGDQYTKPARCVIEREGMSPLSVAIYWYLDFLCFDGRWDRKDNMITEPQYKVKVSTSQIARHFAITRKTVHKGIDELRHAGFVYKEQANFRPGAYETNLYELPFRKRRIEQDEIYRNLRREARENQYK